MLRFRTQLARATMIAALALAPIGLATPVYIGASAPAHAFKFFKKKSEKPKGGGAQGRQLRRTDRQQTIDIMARQREITQSKETRAAQLGERALRDRLIPQWHAQSYEDLLRTGRNPEDFARIGPSTEVDALTPALHQALVSAAAKRNLGSSTPTTEDFEANQSLAARGVVLFPTRDQLAALGDLAAMMTADSTRTISDLREDQISLIFDYLDENEQARRDATNTFSEKSRNSRLAFIDTRRNQQLRFGDHAGVFDGDRNDPDPGDNNRARQDDNSEDEEYLDGRPLYDD